MTKMNNRIIFCDKHKKEKKDQFDDFGRINKYY